MQLKRRVALNGVWLDEIDSRIAVSSVEPADGRENISAVDAAAGYGQRITGNRRSTLDMNIKFRILEHGHSEEGMAARAEVLEKVNAWAANGGVLTVNYKPNRRLNVILAQAPGEGSLWDYTKEFTIVFRAYTVPYWEQETAQQQTLGGGSASGSRAIQIEGSVKTQCNIELLNTSGMGIQNVRVAIGGIFMSFSSLGLGGNETLVIDHNDGLVRIRIRNTSGGYRSAMWTRSMDSADDLMAAPGTWAASYIADRACRMTVSWRARYL